MPPTPAFFARDGELLVPQPSTESGWTPNTLMGRFLSGLVAWGAEQHGGPELQPARLTVDMFRPATMAPTRVVSQVVRDGRRIRVVDTAIVADDVVVCRGSTVFLRRSAEPRGATWLPPDWSAPAPEEVDPFSGRADWQPPWEQRQITPWGSLDEPHRIWLQESQPFIDGESTSPFVRAALAADNANGQVNAGPLGMAYINADLTMALGRLPEGEWIGLEATSRVATDGVSVGTVDLHDRKGRIGHVVVSGLADERNLPPI